MTALPEWWAADPPVPVEMVGPLRAEIEFPGWQGGPLLHWYAWHPKYPWGARWQLVYCNWPLTISGELLPSPFDYLGAE